jgi:hypothetical protein
MLEIRQSATIPGESIGIDSEATEDMFAEYARGPYSELRPTPGVHSVSNGDDRVEVVETDCPSDFPASLPTNDRGFLGRCSLI